MTAFEALDSILSLKDNWNENGAKSFNPELIEKCRKMLTTLPEDLQKTCFVAPTACNSIQFEWEISERYYEIEVYEDFIKLFAVFENNVFVNKEFQDENQVNEAVEQLVLLVAEN